MCCVITILSPFLFLQSLYASFLKSIWFFIYLSPLIFIYTPYIFSVNGCIKYASVKRWRSSYTENCPRPFLVIALMETLKSASPSQFASLRSREGCPWQFFCWCLSWKHYNAHASKVSPQCILWFASLRSEEVFFGQKVPLAIFVHGCHGNAEIHIRTKFKFHALHGLQVWEVKK